MASRDKSFELIPAHLKACHACGLVHEIPPLSVKERAECTRCGSVITKHGMGANTAARTAAATLAALILFIPGILLPILETERLGYRSTSSILVGTFQLLKNGHLLVGGVVFVFSILFPLIKLILLFELSVLRIFKKRARAFTYRLVEFAGRWSMMDVLLLAFFVMLVKLGRMVEFHFGPAVIAFILCVIMSMIASLSFDPHSIWED